MRLADRPSGRSAGGVAALLLCGTDRLLQRLQPQAVLRAFAVAAMEFDAEVARIIADWVATLQISAARKRGDKRAVVRRVGTYRKPRPGKGEV